MSQLPVVENAYRDFLAREHKLHDLFLQSIPHYMNSHHGGADIPEQVVLPGAIPWSLGENLKIIYQRQGTIDPKHISITDSEGFVDNSARILREYNEAHGDEPPGDSFWLRHLFYAGYARTRHTYHIEPGLWDELSDMEWPSDAPAEALAHLPLPAFAMKAPDGTIYTVTYDLLSGKEHTGKLELRIGKLQKNRAIQPVSVLHIVGTIDDALDQAINTIVEGHQSSGPSQRPMPKRTEAEFRAKIRTNTEEIINLLLYLAGEDDIVERAGHYPRPFHRHEKALDGTEYEDELEEEPTESDVGVRMQRALRQYKEEPERPEEKDGEGPDKAPHIRRPHPHLYWTGEGREIPKIRYLGPIAVNMDEDDEQEIDPTTQNVE